MQWFIYLLRHLKWIGWSSAAVAATTGIFSWNNNFIPYFKIVDHYGNVKLFNNILDSLSVFINYFFTTSHYSEYFFCNV